jgi:hypothetical protein
MATRSVTRLGGFDLGVTVSSDDIEYLKSSATLVGWEQKRERDQNSAWPQDFFYRSMLLAGTPATANNPIKAYRSGTNGASAAAEEAWPEEENKAKFNLSSDGSIDELVRSDLSESRGASHHQDKPMNAVTYPRRKWKNGQTIVVCFLDGSSEQHDTVKKHFELLDTLGVNLKLEFVGPGGKEDSHVRITFDCQGFQSCIGTQALKIGKDKPTMLLGIREEIRPEELDGLILHEILHMLGFGHELANPNCPIKFKSCEEVFAHYRRYHDWDEDTTRLNVLIREQAGNVWASEWDGKSLMQYPVSGSLTQDGSEVLPNFQLSETDKKWLVWMYPKPQMDLAASSSTTSQTDFAASSPTTLSLAAVFQFPRVNVRVLNVSYLGLCLLGMVCLNVYQLVLKVATLAGEYE